ncbi:MAG: hypothetical protein ACFFAO_02830 [Candidatus Hermodarchaeota archaeon]
MESKKINPDELQEIIETVNDPASNQSLQPQEIVRRVFAIFGEIVLKTFYILNPEPDYTKYNNKTESRKKGGMFAINDQKSELIGTLIRTTEKAVLIQFAGRQQAWIPKSRIYNQFDPNDGQHQQHFIVHNDILRKKGLIA